MWAPTEGRPYRLGHYWLVHALDYASLAALDRLLQRKYTKQATADVRCRGASQRRSGCADVDAPGLDESVRRSLRRHSVHYDGRETIFQDRPTAPRYLCWPRISQR